jgi:hypothetical protein
VSIVLPDPDRAPGDPGHAADTNAIIEAIEVLEARYNSGVFDAAAASAAAASASQSAAAASASAASGSALAASGSAAAASGSASSASGSASTATTKATEAAASAAAALVSENAAGISEGTATAQAALATAERVAAGNSASTATTKANEAAVSAAAALASEVAADASETAAASSASTATTQAGIATTKAGEAATSASAAATSLDSFDDRYLGAKASDPTLDNDGNALLTGALYWNTVSNAMRVWSGAAWSTQTPADASVTPVKTSGGYTAKTANYTATTNDFAIEFTAGSSTLTLPAASGNAGRRYLVRSSGTATSTTIDPNGAELIAGAATLVIAGQGFVEIICDGTGWRVLAGQYALESSTTGRRLFDWNPAFSSGVGGWQQTYGDTGWRDVIASIDSDWTASSSTPKLYIRRINSTGFIEARVGRVTASGSRASLDQVYVLPSGFLGDGRVPIGSADNVTASMSGLVTLQGSTNQVQLKFYGGGTYAAGEQVFFEGMWSINEAWPSSLPGTAVGSLP